MRENMKKWEYKILRLNTFSGGLSYLKREGENGWEVCAFDYDHSEILLKREIENE